MNGIPGKIEIFKPFGEAYELTKKILFQPFVFKKWCVIGFAAFLAYLNGGGFTGFRLPGNWINHVSRDQRDFHSFFSDLDPIWWVLIALLIFVALAVFVVLSWVRARGHFIFIDCIVHDRAAIAKPWNEYAREGNSYFIFSLLATLVILTVVGVFAILVIGGIWLVHHGDHNSAIGIILLVLAFIALMLFLIVFGTVIQFVAPVMYRRRCKAWPAFVDLLTLFAHRLGPFVLYFLFSIVIGLGVAIAMLIAICVTCCLAALPYVGTVILLPIFVLMQSFSLLFLRQFGPEYDVWADVARAEQSPPPIQTSPPPATQS